MRSTMGSARWPRAGCAGDDLALAAGLDGLKTAHAYLGHAGPLAGVLDELEPLLRRRAAETPFNLIFEARP